MYKFKEICVALIFPIDLSDYLMLISYGERIKDYRGLKLKSTISFLDNAK